MDLINQPNKFIFLYDKVYEHYLLRLASYFCLSFSNINSYYSEINATRLSLFSSTF